MLLTVQLPLFTVCPLCPKLLLTVSHVNNYSSCFKITITWHNNCHWSFFFISEIVWSVQKCNIFFIGHIKNADVKNTCWARYKDTNVSSNATWQSITLSIQMTSQSQCSKQSTCNNSSNTHVLKLWKHTQNNSYLILY